MNLLSRHFPLAVSTLAISAAFGLAGCANFAGIQTSASLKPVSEVATAQSLPAQNGQWPDQSWARQFGGDALQALVDEALRDNPGLQAAAYRVNTARAIAESARAASMPGVGAAFSSTRQRYTEHGIIPPPLAGSYQTDSQATVNLNVDFDFWGRHEAALRSALAQGKVAEAEQVSSRLVLSSAVARGWVQLARQQAQFDLTARQIKARQQLDQLAVLRYTAGLDARIDREQARQQIANLRAEQAQWQEAMALTRNQLAALLGQGPDRGRSIVAPGLPDESTIALPEALPLGLLGRRPDIVAARWRVEAAQGDIDAAKAQFYPNVNLTAFAGLSSLGLSNLLQAGSQVIGIGPAIRLPIFEGGSLRAQLKGRVAAWDVAVASYNQTLTDALHDVADQVQSLRAAQIQAGELHTASEAASQATQLAAQRERIGTTNMLPVLASELGLLAQQKTEIDLRARRAELQIGLIKSLGGGFDASSSAGLQAKTADLVNSLSKSGS